MGDHSASEGESLGSVNTADQSQFHSTRLHAISYKCERRL